MTWFAATARFTSGSVSELLPLAILSGLVLTAVAVSFLAMFRAQAAAQAAEKRARHGQQRYDSALEALEEKLKSVTAQLQEIRQQPPAVFTPGTPKPGLNLTKRSQALRMHRRGDPPDQIAAALEIPVQEVDLLLKIQRIVLSNI